MTYPCSRRVVVAVLILPDGRFFVGSNECGRKPPKPCPRLDKPSGVGYEACKDVCWQYGHAETTAVKAAIAAGVKIDWLSGSSMHIIGHTHSCPNCESVMRKCGITKVYFCGEKNVPA